MNLRKLAGLAVLAFAVFYAITNPHDCPASAWRPCGCARSTPPRRPAAGSAWHDTGLIFCTAFGTPFDSRNFNRSWDALCLKAGVRKITV